MSVNYVDAGTGQSGPRFMGYRWAICALLFFATTINYMDRQVLGLLAPTLEKEIGWNEIQYGAIISWFTLAYAFGQLGAGRLMDKIGTRLGYAAAIVVWSLAAMSHALAGSVGGFSAARFALGIGEAGNFPAAIKTVAEWFPARERALATGIFNAGSNIGAVVAPIMVPIIALNWGWRWAFVWTGILSAIWLVFWLLLYRTPEKHPRLSPQELAYIKSDPPSPAVKMSWGELLKHRQTWAFAIAKLLTDPIWWFYLFWLPKFLDARFGIQLSKVTLPLIVIYVIADIGSIGGGWLSGFFIKGGWSVNKGRKITLLAAALLIVPTMFAPHATSLWMAVGVVSVAAASHQWWSANLFTTASDMFPQQAIGSVIGIGGMAGALGGWAFQRATGWVLQVNGHNYTPIFIVCGLAYVTALLILHMLVPRLERAKLPELAA